jgi:hypothetical protein
MTERDYALSLGGMLRYREFTIPYTDLTTVGTAHTSTLFNLPKFGKVLGVCIKHSVAFAGAGPMSACTVSVGVAGTVALFASAFNVFQAVADTTLQNSAGFLSSSEAETAVIATWASVGGNFSAATAGQVTIRVLYMDVTTPA